MFCAGFKEQSLSTFKYVLLEGETLDSALTFLNIISSPQPLKEIQKLDVKLVIPIYIKFDAVCTIFFTSLTVVLM
jgi:hypothetical protein